MSSMKYSTPKIVQPGSRQGYLWLVLGLLTLLALVVGWQSFDLGRGHAGDELRQLRVETADQQQRITELEQLRAALQEQLAGLERANQVDREAMRQVREQLAGYQQERVKMEEELTFLRSMVSSKGERGALRIQRFQLQPAGEKGSYRFSFTVTQTLANETAAVGSIFFAVDGTQNGKPLWLPLREITEEKSEKLKMRFNNFQDVEGLIRLPEDFEPRRVIVEIKPNNKKLPEVKEHFDWVLAE